VDTFCLIFKTFGDYLLPIIGLAFAAGTLFPTLEKWFKKRERAMKKSRYGRIIFGVSLGVFCVTLIAASIRIQIVQSREQSPIYRNQIVLKFHTQKLASDISKYADECLKRQKFDFQTWTDEFALVRILPIMHDLSTEGIDTETLRTFPWASILQTPNAPIDKQTDDLREISKELNRLAEQLPTTTK
jgi:hypothetical protein